jgi:pimeloyl-ACP methyl ester carboxylesterase
MAIRARAGRRRRSRVTVLALCASMALAPGCALIHLKHQREAMAHWRDVTATVRRAQPTNAPIIVVLYARDAHGAARIVSYDVLLNDGAFHFIVPPGHYHVLAFEDRNRNFVYDGEPIGYLDHPPFRTERDADAPAAEIVLPAAGGKPPPFPIDLSSAAYATLSAHQTRNVGTIVNLDDPRFSSDNGSLGLWAPLDFREKVGGGIFFLAPYDAHKVPVLFVHGLGGTPADWKYLIGHLDRQRFQPWVLYYPSGASLEVAALVLSRTITDLHVRLGFETLYVVAHSMGGLLARSFISQQVHTGHADFLKLFVTLSTPWSGHRAAELAPQSVPLARSWEEMRPSSTFIRQLFAEPLPDHIRYCLLFSYAGNNSLMRGINDGTVTIASELRYAAQDEADAVLGLEESHDSILRSARTSRLLNRTLEDDGCGFHRKRPPRGQAAATHARVEATGAPSSMGSLP